MQTTIYALICPLTLEVKYIGQTTMKLNIRLMSHLSEAKCGNLDAAGQRTNKRHQWIHALAEQGLKPLIEVIALVPADTGVYWERFYIHSFSQCYTLLNGNLQTDKPINKLKVGMLFIP